MVFSRCGHFSKTFSCHHALILIPYKYINFYYFPAELGDYESKSHNPGYVSDFRFISAQTEEFESDVEAAHASMTGMGIVPATAEMTYLEKVKWLDMYGVDLHPVIVSFYQYSFARSQSSNNCLHSFC